MSLFDDPFYLINQRLKDLEAKIDAVYGGRKVGLGDAVLESGSGSYEITSFGENDWQDDAGDKTPEVTLQTGSRVMIFAGFRVKNIGYKGSTVGVDDFRSLSVVTGIQIDSTEPQSFPLPTMRAQTVIATDQTASGAFVYLPLTFTTFREDLEPGEHTFTMRFYAYDSAPTGTRNPEFDDTSLMVFPLGFQ